MPLKIRIQQTEKGFTGYLSNKVYKAPTRQGVIDLAMAEWLTIEDLPKVDLEPLMKRIRCILEQCPTSSLFDVFCYERDRWDFEGWHDNDAFLQFIEEQHAIEPEECSSEDLVDVLSNLGFNKKKDFEVRGYVSVSGSGYWVIAYDSNLYYYIASIRHSSYSDNQLYYYEHVKKYAITILDAVAFAPNVEVDDNKYIAVRVNLARQVLKEQAIGVVDTTLAGDEK